MPDSLQLLNSAAQVTSDAFGRIDANLTKSLALQQQARQFEVGMTAKAVQFAEEKRMNDARIEDMKDGNALRAKQMEMEMELRPLRYQTAQLQLEATKERYKREKDAADKSAFNEITAFHDDQMGFNLIKTRSPEMAQEYLALKANWRNRVASGLPFDDAMFSKQMEDITKKYSSATIDPNTPFDETTHYLLGQVSPKAQAAYERQNPIIKQHRNALAVNALNDEKNEWIDKYGSLWDNAEIGSISMGVDIFQTNEKRIDGWFKQMTELQNKIVNANEDTSPETKKNYISQIEEYRNNIIAAQEQNKRIKVSFAQGDYAMSAKEEKAKEEEDKAKLDPKKYLDEPKEATETVAGIPSGSKDPVVIRMRQKVNDVAAALNIAPDSDINKSILGEVNLSWFTNPEKWNKGEPDDRTRVTIRNHVYEKIESLENVGDVFTKDVVDKLIGQLHEYTSIPISGWMAEEFSNAPRGTMGAKIYGNRDNATTWDKGTEAYPYMRFGKGAEGLGSHDDIQNTINKLPRRYQKAAQEEIYAALVAAALTKAVENK